MNSIYLILIIVSIISLNNSNIEEKRKVFYQDANAFNFTDKVALITGSGTGIGSETARLFCYLGGQAVITNIEPNSVKKVAEECQQLSPNKIKPLEVVADLTKKEDVKRLADETIKYYGKIDILVNVAAVLHRAPISNKNFLDGFDKTLKVNLRAMAHLIREVVPFLKQTNGTIVNFGSIASKLPVPSSTAYIISKAGVLQLTRTLAVELGPHIRVNSVSPGLISGVPMGRLPAEYLNKIRSKTALGRNGNSFDVAKAVMFLVSPLSQWITGQTLDIDGGFYGDIVL